MEFPLKGLTITRTKFDKEQNRRVETGKEVWDVFVNIDMERLAHHLGVKAAQNKARRSRALGGLITVEVRPSK